MLEKMKEIYAWLVANYENLAIFLSMLLGALEVLFRIVPTKSGESFIQRAGAILKKLMDLAKIPNVKREGSRLGLHKPDEKPKS